jgi:hypothetical protein
VFSITVFTSLLVTAFNGGRSPWAGLSNCPLTTAVVLLLVSLSLPNNGYTGAQIILGRCPSLSAHDSESMLRTYLVCGDKQEREEEREASKRHVGEAHSVLTTAILLPQRLSCYWGKIVSLRMLASIRLPNLRLTTAQQRSTGQNLLSDLHVLLCNPYVLASVKSSSCPCVQMFYTPSSCGMERKLNLHALYHVRNGPHFHFGRSFSWFRSQHRHFGGEINFCTCRKSKPSRSCRGRIDSLNYEGRKKSLNWGVIHRSLSFVNTEITRIFYPNHVGEWLYARHKEGS